MMKNSLLPLLALLCFVTCSTACKDTRYGATSSVATSPDAGLPDTEEQEDLLPQPTPEEAWAITSPIKIHEGSIQIFGQLVAAGDLFAAIWLENTQGRIFVMAAWIDPSTMEISDPIIVSPDYDTLDFSPNNAIAAWTGSELAIAWATEETIRFRRLRPDGSFVEDPTAVVIAAGTNTQVKGVIPLPSGRFGIVWLDDRMEDFNYLPWFANVGPDIDNAQEEHYLLVDDETSIQAGSVTLGRPDPCLCNDRWWISLSWHRRDGPGTLDVIKLTTFDQDGQIQETADVIERDTIHLSYQGKGTVDAGASGVHVSGWDVDQGSFVVQMMTPNAPSIVQLPGGDARPVLGTSEVWGPAALTLSGEDLFFYAPNTTVPLEPYAEPLLLSRIEEVAPGYAMAGNANGFGILWEEEDALFFIMARPLEP